MNVEPAAFFWRVMRFFIRSFVRWPVLFARGPILKLDDSPGSSPLPCPQDLQASKVIPDRFLGPIWGLGNGLFLLERQTRAWWLLLHPCIGEREIKLGPRVPMEPFLLDGL